MNCNLFEDPLDSEDFDAVKYINHRFPTGITSSALLCPAISYCTTIP